MIKNEELAIFLAKFWHLEHSSSLKLTELGILLFENSNGQSGLSF